jgi:pilus assembly protein CpaE
MRRHTLEIVLVGDGAEQLESLNSALLGLDDLPLEISITTPDPGKPPASSVDVVMILFNEGNNERQLKYLSSFASREPRPAMFAMLESRSPDVMRRALRAGADELLFLPLDPGNAIRALLKIDESKHFLSRTRSASIISITSLVGGTGVTSLAANLSLALQSVLKKRVALIDLDLQKRGLSVFLDFDPKRTICDLTGSSKGIDSIELETVLARHPSGLCFLGAPKQIEDSEYITEDIVGTVLEIAAQLFDYVVVDCGSHVSTVSVATWERSNHLFYVLDQSVGSAQGAWRFVDLCKRLGLKSVIPQFVLNRFVKDHPISEAKLSDTCAEQMFATIPCDDKLFERVQCERGDLWDLAPHSALAKSYSDFARKLDLGAEAAVGDSTHTLMSRFLSVIGAHA